MLAMLLAVTRLAHVTLRKYYFFTYFIIRTITQDHSIDLGKNVKIVVAIRMECVLKDLACVVHVSYLNPNQIRILSRTVTIGCNIF